MPRRSMATIFECSPACIPRHHVPHVSLAGPGVRGRAVLLFVVGGRHRGAGGDPHSAAISGAGDWTRWCCAFSSRSCRGRSACGSTRCLQLLASSGFLFILISRKHFLQRDTLCRGDPGHGAGDLYGPRLAWPGVAIRRAGLTPVERSRGQLSMAGFGQGIGRRALSGTRAGSAWAPLREPLFRSLWIAAVISYTGTWMQNVGAGWLHDAAHDLAVDGQPGAGGGRGSCCSVAAPSRCPGQHGRPAEVAVVHAELDGGSGGGFWAC